MEIKTKFDLGQQVWIILGELDAEREQKRLSKKLEKVKAYLRALIGEYQL